MQNWQDIWNNNSRVDRIILEMLIKADGFDSPTGNFEVEDWIRYTDSLYQKVGAEEGDSVYDVGCGSGAFIYPLFLKKHIVGGLDYSDVLIQIAQKVISSDRFKRCEAVEIDCSEKYDIVLSHSVFFYFKDHGYAREVIKKMIEKSNKKIAIFDINDLSKKEAYHNSRMQTMTKEEYEKKYKNLEHLFYAKDFFREIAEEHNLNIEIWDQDFKKYSNSKFRFNVLMEKATSV